jgi:hypothetical protein
MVRPFGSSWLGQAPAAEGDQVDADPLGLLKLRVDPVAGRVGGVDRRRVATTHYPRGAQ